MSGIFHFYWKESLMLVNRADCAVSSVGQKEIKETVFQKDTLKTIGVLKEITATSYKYL